MFRARQAKGGMWAMVSWLSHSASAVAHGLHQHPFAAVLLILVLPVVVGYWYYGPRLYGEVAQANGERHQIVSPVMLGPLARSFDPYPAPRLPERVAPAPFEQWLLPQLGHRGLTVSQLARQLDRPPAAILAVLYEVPVGAFLPSAALADAICAHLQLDPDEGRAVFFAVLNNTQTGRGSDWG